MQLLDWFSSDLAPLNLSEGETSKAESVSEDPHPRPGDAAGIRCRLTLVDDHLLQLPLVCGSLQYFLVDGVGGDQAIHHHRLGLTDAVAAVLSLEVCLGVLRGAEHAHQHTEHPNNS